MTAAPPLLEARGLACRLGGRRVVDGASFTLRAGEIVGLLGPNGAGKTTLFRLLAGELRPEAGQVRLLGRDVTTLPLHARARLGLGYLPQGASAFAGLSAADNVAVALEARGRPRREADAFLDAVGLLPLARRRAARLSGGERRRLELARLMAFAPRVLLLDEPLAALDADTAARLAARLGDLAAGGAAILLADHRVAEARRLCRRAFLMHDGLLAPEGRAAPPAAPRAPRPGAADPVE